MNDKTMLELAAKAAGYEVLGLASKWIAQGFADYALLIRNGKGGDSVFDPLTDDGDALRLAVKLRLTLQCATGLSIVTYEDRDARIKQTGERHNLQQDSACAATRRAIVRAAAEIGRAMG